MHHLKCTSLMTNVIATITCIIQHQKTESEDKCNIGIFAPGWSYLVARAWSHYLLDYSLEEKVQLIYAFKRKIIFKHYKTIANNF